jgi:hypothetical protein
LPEVVRLRGRFPGVNGNDFWSAASCGAAARLAKVKVKVEGTVGRPPLPYLRKK